MKQSKRNMETFRLFISICALNTLKCSHQTSSEFQLLNTALDNNNTTLLTTHQCFPIYVNINLDLLLVCASMCMNPKSVEWEDIARRSYKKWRATNWRTSVLVLWILWRRTLYGLCNNSWFKFSRANTWRRTFCWNITVPRYVDTIQFYALLVFEIACKIYF